MDLASTSSRPIRKDRKVLLCELVRSFIHSFTHSVSARLKLLMRAEYHAGSGDLAVNHHTGKPVHTEGAGFPGVVGTREWTPLLHGAGNQMEPGTCEQAGFEGKGRRPRSPQTVTSFLRLELRDLSAGFPSLFPTRLCSH